MLVIVGSTVNVDYNILAVDCSGEEFRTIEASLYQANRKHTAENGTTHKKTEGIRSVAREFKEIRPEAHV